MIFHKFAEKGFSIIMGLAIILSLLWVGFDAKDNMLVQEDTVVYYWADGQYHVVERENAFVSRPFLKVQRFINTFGDNTSSLIGTFIIAFDDAVSGFYSDDIEPPNIDGLWFNEIIVAYLSWFKSIGIAVFDFMITVLTFPVLVVEWLVSSLFGILGFLVTGENFTYTSQVYEWLTGLNAGI